MVLPDSRRVARVPHYLGNVRASAGRCRLRDSHPLRCDVPVASPTVCATPSRSHTAPRRSHNPRPTPTTGGPLTWVGFRLNPVRSPLLRVSRLLSSRPGTEMFQFPGCPPRRYELTPQCPAIKRDGLPHSEITGSWPACSSPVRIVARHVLPRHWFPEHPPYALISLTTPPVRPPAAGQWSRSLAEDG